MGNKSSKNKKSKEKKKKEKEKEKNKMPEPEENEQRINTIDNMSFDERLSSFIIINNLINEINKPIKITKLTKSKNSTNNINKEEIKFNEPKNIINININNNTIISNLDNKIKKDKTIPNYCCIFENINIFNSILIMINNVSKINETILDTNVKEIIDKCEQNNKPYCLSSVLYYLNKYMWNDKNENLISEKELYEKYKNYIDCFSKNNSNNTNPDNYCYNVDNIVNIFESILKIINNELSKENKSIPQSYNIKNHPIFSKYINDFKNNNKSIISEYFITHFIFMQYCENCLNFCKNNNLIYNNTIHNYYYYFNLIFNIDNINNYYKENNKALKRSFHNNIQTTNIFNLIDCFEYTFSCNNNISKREFCINCKQNSYISQYYIFELPDILPIIFSSNNNYNFVLQDKINLKKYERNGLFKNKDNSDIKNYKLISILCQFIYNQKFICYCINPNNGLWYSYTDGKITKVENMDINAIPLIAFYQNEETIKFKYNNIKRDDKNKICLNINFINQMPDLKLLFNKNTEIKNVIQYIRDIRHLEGKIKLLKSGTKVNDEEILIDLIDNDKDYLDFIVHLYKD